MAIPLTLKVFKGATLVSSQDFARDIIKIGRLSSAHLRLDDEKVSRVHSVIEAAADGSLSIIDMGSVEGTYVNGKRVNKSRISFGDEIRLGETILRLENPAAVAAVNLAAAVASTDAAPAPVTQAPAPAAVQSAPVASEPAPAPALEPSTATTEQNETLPTEPQAPQAEPTAPVRTVRRSHTSGPLGVSLSFVWGDQRVGEFFLPPGQKKSFTVGSAEGVDFVMGDSRLGSPKLEVLRTDGHTSTVCFTGKMKGELIRDAETLDLEAVIESGKASREDAAYTLTLEPDDVFWVDLGGVALEVCFQPVPKRVHVPLSESVDYRALNILLLMLFASSMFVIGAINRTSDEESFADELSGDHERLTKLIIKPPEPQPNRFLAQLNDQKSRQPNQPKQPSTPQPKEPIRKKTQQVASNSTPATPKNEAQRLTKGLFTGGRSIASLFGPSGGNSELRTAMNNVRQVAMGPGGNPFGMGLKNGPGGPSTGGSTIGLDAIRTPGRAGGNDRYGDKVPGLTGKESVDPTIAPVEFKVNEGSLDRELVRKVIQDNKGQIRSCFESLLNQDPDLNGKVQTQFTIGPDGRVLEAKVSQSTTGNAALDTCVASRVRLWVFPKPKGGGTVVVSYPFIFKQAGK